MNDPDEHTLDEAWGEDPAVPDQARATEDWRGGDVVLAADGSIYTRKQPEGLFSDPAHPWIDGGWMDEGWPTDLDLESYTDEAPPRPLTLLVRDAAPVLAPEVSP